MTPITPQAPGRWQIDLEGDGIHGYWIHAEHEHGESRATYRDAFAATAEQAIEKWNRLHQVPAC